MGNSVSERQKNYFLTLTLTYTTQKAQNVGCERI